MVATLQSDHEWGVGWIAGESVFALIERVAINRPKMPFQTWTERKWAEFLVYQEIGRNPKKEIDRQLILAKFWKQEMGRKKFHRL